MPLGSVVCHCSVQQCNSCKHWGITHSNSCFQEHEKKRKLVFFGIFVSDAKVKLSTEQKKEQEDRDGSWLGGKVRKEPDHA